MMQTAMQVPRDRNCLADAVSSKLWIDPMNVTSKAIEVDEPSFDEVSDSITPGKDFTEWPVSQDNGQRKYGPPVWWKGDPPPKGTEVHLRRLPRKITASELFPIFSQYGTIYTFRLMMNFSGTNKGYGFVQYSNRGEAQTAIKELNNFRISQHYICVEESLDNCRIFIAHIPKHLNQSQLREILGKYMSGLKGVHLYPSLTNKYENRGFCFAEFIDHRSAAMARRYVVNFGIPDFKNVTVSVDWALHEVDGTPANVMLTAIYIDNLPHSTSEEQLLILLENITVNLKFVAKIKRTRERFIVYFANKTVAEYAKNNLNGLMLGGAVLTVTWDKPHESSRHSKNLVKTRKSSQSSHTHYKSEESSNWESVSVLSRSSSASSKPRESSNYITPHSNTNDAWHLPNEVRFLQTQSISYQLPFLTQDFWCSPLRDNLLNIALKQASEFGWTEQEVVSTIVTQLTSTFPKCNYMVLLLLAKSFNWGTICFQSLELDGMFEVSIRLVKTNGSIINLAVYLNPEPTVDDALNSAAGKFLDQYIIEPQMYPIAKVLFFP